MVSITLQLTFSSDPQIAHVHNSLSIALNDAIKLSFSTFNWIDVALKLTPVAYFLDTGASAFIFLGLEILHNESVGTRCNLYSDIVYRSGFVKRKNVLWVPLLY